MLTAVVPDIVADEIFVVGARLEFVATAAGAAAATGFAVVGGVGPAEEPPEGLLKKMRAKMIPMRAKRHKMSQIHQGQGSF